jgi:hypothetical protein
MNKQQFKQGLRRNNWDSPYLFKMRNKLVEMTGMDVPRIYPLMITMEGKKIGIEYKDGKFILIGEKYMDKGVKTLLYLVKEGLQKKELDLMERIVKKTKQLAKVGTNYD